MIILGIDPGSHRIGYGVIAGGAAPRLLHSGIIEFKTETRGERLRQTRKRVAALIRAHTPELIGIETLYFSKNVTTAMAV
ncbi:MAG: crossover junction endodeoxyribonuclease RuvC, partial [Candidatus Liptonbacteria bacterium]|nr:crossover junction endodeoxyribonuclease RuvC [Candidatus Liptonbacteria bacterium]